MCRIWIIGGTTEGRELADFCSQRKISAWISVVSEYGTNLLEKSPYLNIVETRMDREEMETFIREKQILSVFDASHPYAKLASENARAACKREGMAYYRVLRQKAEDNPEGLIWVDTAKEAAAYLEHRQGNVFLSTGSKELEAFTVLDDYKNRIYARVLPDPVVLEQCKNMGIQGKHIIAMQGPFTKEINREMFLHVGAGYLVTKESGAAGGFSEKIQAAAECGMKSIVIGRNGSEKGCSLTQAKKLLAGERGMDPTEFYLIGTGMGNIDQLTLETVGIIENSQVVFGAGRLLDQVKKLTAGKTTVPCYLPSQIETWLSDHDRIDSAVILFSGDTGFFSGCKKMMDMLRKREDCRVQVFPGISSISFLCARLGISWEDADIHSLHGRQGKPELWLSQSHKVFILLGGDHTAGDLCQSLLEQGYGDVTIHIGERLSYRDERVTSGLVREMAGRTFDPLCCVLLIREESQNER